MQAARRWLCDPRHGIQMKVDVYFSCQPTNQQTAELRAAANQETAELRAAADQLAAKTAECSAMQLATAAEARSLQQRLRREPAARKTKRN